MEQILHFLLTYQDQVFLAMFATLAVVALVNFVYNPYAKQNVQLKRFNKRTLHKPSSIVWETKHLPAEYQRQWRAFINSGCAKPSVVFEFVKLPQRYLLWFAHFVAFVVCVGYFVLALILSNQEIFATQVAFVLFSALIFLLQNLIGAINLSHARRVFGKFLHDLNTVVEIVKSGKSCLQTPVENSGTTSLSGKFFDGKPNLQPTVQVEQPITNPTASLQNNVQPKPTTLQCDASVLPQSDISTNAPRDDLKPTIVEEDSLGASEPQQPQILKNRGDVIEKTVQILQQKGLESPRTVEEQRKLNIALNNLLQACCKK